MMCSIFLYKTRDGKYKARIDGYPTEVHPSLSSLMNYMDCWIRDDDFKRAEIEKGRLEAEVEMHHGKQS